MWVNLVLAENLEEFLNLGYFLGWGLFDGLFYHKDITLQEFEIGDSYEFGNRNEGIFLEKIISHFKLKPRSLNEERLKFLKDKYFEKLEFNQEFIDTLGLN